MSAVSALESRVRSPTRTVPVVRFTVKGQGTDDDAPARAPAFGSPTRAYTVVYDGACRICQGLVRRLGKWDKRGLLEIVPSQAPGVHARFPWIPPRAFAQSAWRHLLFGAVLGELERRLNPPRLEPVSDEAVASNGHGSAAHLVATR